MRYSMRAGVLYDESQTVLARLKGNLIGPQKDVFSSDGVLMLRTGIRALAAPAGRAGDVRFREYYSADGNGAELFSAKPDYAPGDRPETAGWPVYRAPRVDRAQISLRGDQYLLIMQNSQNYCMKRGDGSLALQIIHRGLTGGWNIEAAEGFAPETICGIFAFCRYIEQENEFLAV